jgi:hypothetical protein
MKGYDYSVLKGTPYEGMEPEEALASMESLAEKIRGAMPAQHVRTGSVGPEEFVCECHCRRPGKSGVIPDTSWHDAFIAGLGQSPNVVAALEGLNGDGRPVTFQTAYNHRHRFPKFAKRWEMAKNEGVLRMEAFAMARAANMSDSLMAMILKAYMPSRYKEENYNSKVAQLLERLITGIGLSNMSVEQLAAIGRGKTAEEMISALAAAGAGNGDSFRAVELLEKLSHAVLVGSSRKAKELAEEAMKMLKMTARDDDGVEL